MDEKSLAKNSSEQLNNNRREARSDITQLEIYIIRLKLKVEQGTIEKADLDELRRILREAQSDFKI